MNINVIKVENKERPTITAKNAEQFAKIEAALKTLPECVYDQIQNASSGGAVGIECIFRQTNKKENRVWLPKSTTQIQNFGDYIGIYAGDFFFKITGQMYESVNNYAFYEENK